MPSCIRQLFCGRMEREELTRRKLFSLTYSHRSYRWDSKRPNWLWCRHSSPVIFAARDCCVVDWQCATWRQPAGIVINYDSLLGLLTSTWTREEKVELLLKLPTLIDASKCCKTRALVLSNTAVLSVSQTLTLLSSLLSLQCCKIALNHSSFLEYLRYYRPVFTLPSIHYFFSLLSISNVTSNSCN